MQNTGKLILLRDGKIRSSSNDRAKIDADLNAKVAPVLAAGGGYILSTDHSKPLEIDFDTLSYFIEKGWEMSRRWK